MNSEASSKKCFLNRSDFMNHIRFPENSPSLVVTPSNKEGTGFLKHCYDERYLSNHITEIEFDEVIDKSAKIAAKAYSKKRIIDQKGISNWIQFSMYLSGFLSVIYCVAMLFAAKYENKYLLLGSNVLIIPAFFMMIWITILNWRKSSEVYPTFEEITKVDLESYFNVLNERTYNKIGINWGIAQLGHFWIECQITKNKRVLEEVPIEEEIEDNSIEESGSSFG
jgi:hypothetical protein